MKSIAIGLFILFNVLNSHAQDHPEYGNKLFFKEIKRQWSVEEVELEELIPTDYDTRFKHYGYQGKIFQVKASDGNQFLGYAYVGRATCCRAGGCDVPKKESEGTSEYFDYFILYDSIGTVMNVRVFNYQATHGHEVSGKAWLKQFHGYRAEDTLEVGKDIDAISGATISVQAITFDVQYITELIVSLQEYFTK